MTIQLQSKRACKVGSRLHRAVKLMVILGFVFCIAPVSYAATTTSDLTAASAALDLVRQFSQRVSVSQAAESMDSQVDPASLNPRSVPMIIGADASIFPDGISPVPPGLGVPRRDGAGRWLGYCAWDNQSASAQTVSPGRGYLGGLSNPEKLVYAIVSPGKNGLIDTSCAEIITNVTSSTPERGVGDKDDFVYIRRPSQIRNPATVISAANLTALQARQGVAGDLGLTLDDRVLHTYTDGSWVKVAAENSGPGFTEQGGGNISYTGGSVTVNEFIAGAATFSTSVTVSGAATINGALTANTFAGNGAGITDLNASNFSSGTLPVARGGTGLSTVPELNQILIGTGSAYELSTLTAGAGVGFTNTGGVLTLSNTGLLSISSPLSTVNVSTTNGVATIELPQSIATNSTPTFGGLLLNGTLNGTSAIFSGNLTAQRLIVGDSTGGVSNPNIAIGSGVLTQGQSGIGANVGIGVSSLARNTTGYSNQAIGLNALYNNTTGDRNQAIGDYALFLNTSGSSNTAIGSGALYHNTIGSDNQAIGREALLENTSGYFNNAVGRNALHANTTGYENNALGSFALNSNTTGIRNTAIGQNALGGNTTGNLNVAIGNYAMDQANTGNANTAIGPFAVRNNTTGHSNIGIGHTTLNSNTTGYDNSAVGTNSLFYATTGYGNTVLGANAGFTITTGNNNLLLGNATDTGSSALSYAAAIGSGARVATSNTIALGRNSTSDQIVIGTDTRNDTTANTKLYVNGPSRFNGAVIGSSFSGNGASLTSLNANNISSGTLSVARGGTGVSGSAAANGTLLIGNGSGYTLANLTGTTNQVTVTNGAGSITLSLPQSFATTSTPTFGGLTLNGGLAGTSATWSGALTGTAANFSGTVTANAFSGDGSALTALNASNISTGTLGVARGGTGVDGSAAANGALLIGNGTGYTLGTLTGTADQISVTNGSGSITLSLPQSIASTSTPTFGGMTLNGGLAGTSATLSGALSGTTGTFSGAVTVGSLTAPRLDVSTSAGGVSSPNLIVGASAMPGGQSGNGGNSAIGISALAANTAGYFNTAVGLAALYSNTSGNFNTATGQSALYSNTTGLSNSAFGQSALYNNSTGSFNTATGQSGLYSNTTGSSNTALGQSAMYANTTGSFNTAIGLGSLSVNTSGVSNTAVGMNSGNSNTTGANNTFLGYDADASSAALTYATAIGASSIVATSNTIALGRNSTADQVVIGTDTRNDTTANTKLYVNGPSRFNGAVYGTSLDLAGAFTGTSATLSGALTGTTANFSGAVTVGSLTASTTITAPRLDISTGAGGVTNSNMIIGTGAMPLAQSGTGGNTALGVNALALNTSGARNVAVGISAMANNTSGIRNVAVGEATLHTNTTGSHNAALGALALNQNSTGSNNMAVGKEALFANTTGSGNVGVGGRTLFNNTTGSNNTTIGASSVSSNNVTGNYNTMIGSSADVTVDGLSYASAIGASSSVATSNTIALGRNSTVDQVVIGTDTRNDTTANTKLYVNGPSRFNGAVYGTSLDLTGAFTGTTATLSGALTGTTGAFSGAVTVGSLTASTTITAPRLDISTSAGGVVQPNMIIGTGALPLAQSGAGRNTAVGVDALAANTTGADNVAFGFQTLYSNTTGLQNVALGRHALRANTTGDRNIAIGYLALDTNTTGSSNQAIGSRALENNTTGNSNFAMGFTSIAANTSGSNNMAVGNSALVNNTTGNNNTAVGASAAGSVNSTGSNNTFIGYDTDVTVDGLSYATVIGAASRVATSNTIALGRNSTADQVVIGTNSRNDTTANTKLYVNGPSRFNGAVYGTSLDLTGAFTGTSASLSGALTGTTGNFSGTLTANAFSGNGSALTALNASNISTGTLGVARGGTGVDGSAATNGALLIGNGTGYTLGTLTGTADQINVTNGAGSITLSLPQSIASTSTPTFGGMTLNGGLIGTTATLSGALTGATANFSGNVTAQRLYLSDTTGGVTTGNLVVGTGAMAASPSGNGGNTVVGLGAMAANTSGDYNVAMGQRALATNTTGGGNVAIGREALYSAATAYNNIAIGRASLYSVTNGGDNAAIGTDAMFSNTTGFFNQALGSSALNRNTSGSRNQAMGNSALYYNTTGVHNQAIGSIALVDNTTGSNNAAVGGFALRGNTTGSNNVGVGRNAGWGTSGDVATNANLTGSNNTFLGSYAMPGTTTQLNYATALGSSALVTTSNTIALGRTSDVVVIGATGDDASGNKLQVTGGIKGTGNLTIGGAGTFSGTVTANAFSGNGSALTALNASNISTGTLGVARGGTGVDGSAAANGALLIGNGTGYTLGTLTGTANQVNVTNGAGSITLSLPQSIATTSTPTFGGLTLNGGLTGTSATLSGALTGTSATFSGTVTANAFSGDGSALTALNASNITTGTLNVARGGTGVDGSAAANGALLIGNGTGYTLGTLTGTANQINVTNGAGSITLSLPQSIATTSTPTFGGLTLNGGLAGTTGSFSGSVTAQRLLLSDASGGVTVPNIAIGTGNLVPSQSGYGSNVAIGIAALASNTIGADNIALGTEALKTNITGDENTAIGAGALRAANYADQNTAVGSYTMYNTTFGASNTALGSYALYENTEGYFNTALGGSALLSNIDGYHNTAVGIAALSENTTGFYNIALGSYSLSNSTTGWYNSALGAGADLSSYGLAVDYATAIGAGSTVGTSNTIALGRNSTADQVVIGTDIRNNTTANTKLYVNGPSRFNGAVIGSSFSGNGASLTSLNANNIGSGTLSVARGGTGVSGSAAANGALLIGNGTGYTLGTLTGTANQITVTNAAGSITLSLPQNIATTSTPTFGGLTLNGGLTGTTGTFSGTVTANAFSGNGSALTALNASNITTGTLGVARGGTGVDGSAAANGALLIGNGTGYTLSTLTGTANQINVTNGAGSITLSLPQGIATTSTPTFGGMTLNGGLTGTSATLSGALTGTTGTFSGTLTVGSLSAPRLDVSTSAGGVSEANLIVGSGAMPLAQSGFGGNTALGMNALASNQSGYDNTAIGYDALRRNTTGLGNVSIGNFALANSLDGGLNNAVGIYALGSVNTGSSNLGMGAFALYETTSGLRNTAVGGGAGAYVTTGSYNSFLGYFAHAIETSGDQEYMTAVGAYSEVATSNTIALGRNSADDQVVIGSDSRNGVHKLYVNGTALGTAWNTTSDRRLKTDISTLSTDDILTKLGQFSAHRYRYIANPEVGFKIGVIAQDVENLFPEVAGYNGGRFLSVDYNALGAMAAVGVGQLNKKVQAIEKDLVELKGVNDRVKTLETWREGADRRMDSMQAAIDANLNRLTENILQTEKNTASIKRLDEVLVTVEADLREQGGTLKALQDKWARTFSASEDGRTLRVQAQELTVSNFTAEQARVGSVYALRLEAEMAKIKELEVDTLKANKAIANSVQAQQVNTGSAQVYAGVASPAVLFSASGDGHYTVNTSALDGSYATATVIVNAGQAKVVPIANEGIELIAVGNTVKAVAAGKSIKASWIKTG